MGERERERDEDECVVCVSWCAIVLSLLSTLASLFLPGNKIYVTLFVIIPSVAFTVFVSTMVLDSGWGKTLINVLGHM